MNKRFEGPLILGHRGAPAVATENTLRSFDQALRLGADGVEMDVRATRDGQAAVIHDPSLRRTMDCDGDIESLPFPAIARLTNGEVPDFDQVAAWASASGAWLNVEFKTAGLEDRVLESLGRTGMTERSILSSFEHQVVAALVAQSGDIPVFLLTKCWDAKEQRVFEELGAKGVCLHVDAADEPTLNDLKGHGIPAIVWTVNDSGVMQRLFTAGVMGIISDDPERAARERRKWLASRPA